MAGRKRRAVDAAQTDRNTATDDGSGTVMVGNNYGSVVNSGNVTGSISVGRRTSSRCEHRQRATSKMILHIDLDAQEASADSECVYMARASLNGESLMFQHGETSDAPTAKVPCSSLNVIQFEDPGRLVINVFDNRGRVRLAETEIESTCKPIILVQGATQTLSASHVDRVVMCESVGNVQATHCADMSIKRHVRGSMNVSHSTVNVQSSVCGGILAVHSQVSCKSHKNDGESVSCTPS